MKSLITYFSTRATRCLFTGSMRYGWGLFSAFLLLPLAGCTEQQGANQYVGEESFSQAEQQALEKKASLKELRLCFAHGYLAAEGDYLTARQVAVAIRERCEPEFQHFRAVKVNFAQVPDILSPPQRVVAEEIALTEAFVLKSRKAMSELHGGSSESELFALPPGHPPIHLPYSQSEPDEQI